MNNQTKYRVTWIIDLEASTPIDAARRARDVMQDKESIATIFEIKQDKAEIVHTIDLLDYDK